MKNLQILLLILLFSGSAFSVQLSKNNQGQVLLFPYYTVNGGFNTLMSITNSKDKSKAVRVRFREAANGREVFAMNLYLGPLDTWTGALYQDHEEQTALISNDHSCTLPIIDSPIAFSQESYTGDNYDGIGGWDDRIHEGFIEVIEMGEVIGEIGASIINQFDNQIDCGAIYQAWDDTHENPIWQTDPSIDMLSPSGGLTGSVTLIDVEDGVSISEPVTAINDFTDDILHFNYQSSQPNLADSKSVSHIIHDNGVIEVTWPTGIEAFSSVLMKSSLYGEFALETSINAKTDWVVTFPTKQFFIDPSLNPTTVLPFSGPIQDHVCQEVHLAFFNREQQRLPTYNFGIPPAAPHYTNQRRNKFCFNTNVLSFSEGEEVDFFQEAFIPAEDSVFDSNFQMSSTYDAAGFQGTHYDVSMAPPYSSGSAIMNLFNNGTYSGVADENEVFFDGLPVIGFTTQTYTNQNAQPGLLANYAGSFEFDSDSNLYLENQVEALGGMSISEDGKGQVLLFPYYTVRNGLDSLISIVNTTNEVKALKVRFREGRNNRSVFSFNLYLGAYDVWTAALTKMESQQTGFEGQSSVKLITSDNSCTVPNVNGMEFNALQFTGSTSDGRGDGLQRLTEGNIEIFDMGEVIGVDAEAASQWDNTSTMCGRLVNNWSAPSGQWFIDPEENILSPYGLGGVSASLSLINVANGYDLSYDATAIASFYVQTQHTAPNDSSPNLSDSTSRYTLTQTDDGYVQTIWDSGIDAVTALFMKDKVNNDFVIARGINGATEWVTFFPTKQYYTDPMFSGSEQALPPFTGLIEDNCVTYQFEAFNREQANNDSGIISSPNPPIELANQRYCYTTNVLSLSANDNEESLIFGSNNINENVFYDGLYPPDRMPFDSGWMKANFNRYFDAEGQEQYVGKLTGVGVNGEIHTLYGLPVLGFAAQRYENGTLAEGTTLANYAVIHQNRYSRKLIVNDLEE